MQHSSRQARPVLTVVMACLAQIAGGGLGWSSLPPLMPAIAVELSISHTMDGVIWGAVPLGVALLSILGGAAVDRYGARLIGFLSIFAGAVTVGIRGMLYDAWSLALTMLIFGISIAFQSPTIPKTLADHILPERLGAANGWTTLALAAGQAFVMISAVGLFVPLFGGWRPFQVAAGAVMAAVAVAWFVFVRDRSKNSEDLDIKGVLGFAKDRQMVRLTTIFFLQFGGYLVMLGLLPHILSGSGLSPDAIAIAISAWLVTVGLCNFLGAWWSDRIGLRRPFMLYGAILCGISLAVLAFLPASAAIWLLIIAGAGSGIFGALLYAIPAEMPGIGLERMGSAIGFMMVFSQVATFILSVITGAAADAGGLRAALLVLACAHFAIIIPARKLLETGWSSGADEAGRNMAAERGMEGATVKAKVEDR
ncbi:MAG: Hexuronate transporter [Syntrophorhabdus sp. PtaU1.Bin058]|nr:MAG: Hexuronate transporter [Syntrophorhabdus sp. PtaU1.Bin058]